MSEVIYRFGDFAIEGTTLQQGGEVLKSVTPRQVRLIEYFITNRDRILSEQELYDRLWDHAAVTKAAVPKAVARVVEILGAAPDGGWFIERFQRRGWKFVASVEIVAPTKPVETVWANDDATIAKQCEDTLERAEERLKRGDSPTHLLSALTDANQMAQRLRSTALRKRAQCALGTYYLQRDDVVPAAAAFTDALRLAKGQDDKLGAMRYLNNLALVSRRAGKPRRALRLLRDALAIAEELEDSEHRALFLYNLGRVSKGVGDTDNALVYYNSSVEIARANHYDRILHDALAGKAALEIRAGQWQQGAESYRAALHVISAATPSSRLTTFHNIGVELFERRLFGEAVDAFRLAISQARDVHDLDSQVDALRSVGRCLTSMGAYGAAIDVLQEALSLSGPDPAGTLELISNVGDAFMERGQPDRALYWLEQGVKHARNEKDWWKVAVNLNNIGVVLDREHHAARAIPYIQEALRITETRTKDEGERAIYLENLASAFARLRNWDFLVPAASAVTIGHRALTPSRARAMTRRVGQLVRQFGAGPVIDRLQNRIDRGHEDQLGCTQILVVLFSV